MSNYDKWGRANASKKFYRGNRANNGNKKGDSGNEDLSRKAFEIEKALEEQRARHRLLELQQLQLAQQQHIERSSGNTDTRNEVSIRAASTIGGGSAEGHLMEDEPIRGLLDGVHSKKRSEVIVPKQPLIIKGYLYDPVADRYYRKERGTFHSREESIARIGGVISEVVSAFDHQQAPPSKKRSIGMESCLNFTQKYNHSVHSRLIEGFSRHNLEAFINSKLRISFDQSYFLARNLKKNRFCHLSFHPNYGLASVFQNETDLSIIKSVANEDERSSQSMQYPIDIELEGISCRPSCENNIIAVCGNTARNNSGCLFLYKPSNNDRPSSAVWMTKDGRGGPFGYTIGLEWHASGQTLCLLRDTGDIVALNADQDLRPAFRIGAYSSSVKGQYSNSKSSNFATSLCTAKLAPPLHYIGYRGGELSLFDIRSNSHSSIYNALGTSNRSNWLAVDHLSLLRDEFSLVAQDINGKIIALDTRFPKSEVRIIYNGLDSNRIRKRKFWISPCENFLLTSYEGERKYPTSIPSSSTFGCGLAAFPLKYNIVDSSTFYKSSGSSNSSSKNSSHSSYSNNSFTGRLNEIHPAHVAYLPVEMEFSTSIKSPNFNVSKGFTPRFICKSWIQLAGNSNYSGANYDNLSSFHCLNPFAGLFGALNWEDEAGVVSVQSLIQGDI